MNQAEFLAWEVLQEERYEFDGTKAVAMADVTCGHDATGGTLRALLLQQLRGKSWRVSGPTLKIEVADRIRYPDAFIHHGPVAASVQVIREPIVVFEILSMTAADRAERLRDYQATPSVQRYVVLERDDMAATEFVRQGGLWAVRTLAAGDILVMTEIGVEIGLSEIYAEAGLVIPDIVVEEPASTAIERLFVLGRERGYLTFDEINTALPDRLSSFEIEEVLVRLSEVGISVVESPNNE